MPAYIYKHPTENKYVEVIQGMNDEHVFFDYEGLQWRRVFTVPQAVMSSVSSIDPFDRKSQIEKTGNIKGTVGDLWDISKEMSIKREDKLGCEDPVKREYFNEYKKQNGCKHWHDRKKKIETDKVIIKLDE